MGELCCSAALAAGPGSAPEAQHLLRPAGSKTKQTEPPEQQTHERAERREAEGAARPAPDPPAATGSLRGAASPGKSRCGSAGSGVGTELSLPAGGEGGRFPGPPARRRVRPAFPFGVKSNGVRIKMRFSGLRLRGCQRCRSKSSRDPRVMGLYGALWGPWRKGHVCHTPGPKHSEGFGAAPVAAHLPQGRTPHLAEVTPGKAPDFSPKEQVDVSKINFRNQQKDP